MVNQNRNVWLEKYRPKYLDDIKGHKNEIETIKRQIESGQLPNMLFSGPPGVGKTATAVAIARELYGENWSDYFLELNASDNRGIDVVRDDVKNFAKTASDENYRIIFLDESDALTDDAQSALRRTMETYSSNVRFILSCNYPSQIIPPIQSRCSIHRFDKLDDDAIISQINEICSEESIKLNNSAIDAICYASDGDMRRTINILQAVSIYDREINKEDIFEITNTVKPEIVRSIIKDAVNGKFIKARDETRQIMDEKGITSSELLEQFYDVIWNDNTNIKDKNAVQISDYIGEVDYRLTQGANEKIQIDSLLSKISDLNDK